MPGKKHIIFKTQFLKYPGKIDGYGIEGTLKMSKNHKKCSEHNEQAKLTDYDMKCSYMKRQRVQKQGEDKCKITVNTKKAQINRADMIQNQIGDISNFCSRYVNSGVIIEKGCDCNYNQ